MNRIRLRELREAKGLFPATIDEYLGVMRGSCSNWENGFLNHYRDFIVRTEAGRSFLMETKGDDRDNSNRQRNIRPGRKWVDCAGPDYKM